MRIEIANRLRCQPPAERHESDAERAARCRACGKCKAFRQLMPEAAFDAWKTLPYSANQAMQPAAQAGA